ARDDRGAARARGPRRDPRNAEARGPRLPPGDQHRDRQQPPGRRGGGLGGEARDVARTLVGLARGIRAGQGPVAAPACLIAGGETTVTVRGAGSGGRCQEWALAAALELDGVDGIVGLAAGTDGTDGPTEAAGAVVDGATT